MSARKSVGKTFNITEDDQQIAVNSADGLKVELSFSFEPSTVKLLLDYVYTGSIPLFAPLQRLFYTSMKAKKKALAQLNVRDRKQDPLTLSVLAEELCEAADENKKSPPLPEIDVFFLSSALRLSQLVRVLKINELAEQCDEIVLLGLELCVHKSPSTIFPFIRTVNTATASPKLLRDIACFIVTHFTRFLEPPRVLDLSSAELTFLLGSLRETTNFEPKTIDEILGLSLHTTMRLSLKDLEQCKKILKQLQTNKNATPFLEPVDWELLNLPTYPEIIKEPMDYHTIQNKLETRQYRSHDDFANDVRLVSKNAMTFNMAGSVFYKAANDILKTFETSYERKKWDIPITRPSRRRVGPPVVEPPPGDLTVSAVAPPANPFPNSSLVGSTREFTVHDRRSLATRLAQLSASHAREAVEILRSAIAAVEDEGSSERVSIDLRDIDDEHLRRLESFLDRVAPPPPKAISTSSRAHQTKRPRP